MEIGIMGLGAMGRAMARNLAAAGHDVKAWNRSGGYVEGVTMVASPVAMVPAFTSIRSCQRRARSERVATLITGAAARP